MTRIPGLDGVRAIAVSLVVISHFYEASPKIRGLSLGHCGVMIFFVLSGFLVSRILLQQREKSKKIVIKNFFARRALRIFPLYYLSIFIFSLFGVGFGIEIIHHLTYTTNFHILSHQDFLAPHFWSLAVEEQFYLLLPFLLLFTNKKAFPTICIALFLSGIVIRTYYWSADCPRYDRLLWSNTDALGLGIIVAIVEARKINFRKFYVLSLVPIILSLVIGSSFLTFHFGLLSCSAICLSQLAKLPKNTATKILDFGPIRYTGTISYGIYVWHYLLWQNKTLFAEAREGLVKLHPLMEFGHGDALIIGVLTMIFSIVSYEIFEKPILRLKHKFV